MDDGNSRAEALAIRGDNIIAVGTNGEVVKHRGANTMLVNLDGKTLVPGFIDSHQHRIGDRWKLNIKNAKDVIQPAIQQGWTTLNELYVDEGRLNELRDLDRAGVLPLRVNAHLPVMENSPEGKLLGDWYAAYSPGQKLSPHVRVAGLKIFTDFDNAKVLLWKQDKLNSYLLKRHQEGWPLAIKTVSTRSLEMILKAFEYIEKVDPKVIHSRARLEHVLFATPEQIKRIKYLGLILSIQTNMPGELVGDPDVDALIAREPQGSYAPWRSMFQAGIIVVNGTAWPSYYVDEPTGAPFGSPIHITYQAVKRVGNLGTQPYPWLLDQTITAEQAIRALTINAAYATFEESVKGSLTPGKLADMVILSDNPLTVTPEQINNIQVLMTMIGGKVEYCLAGYKSLCPAASSAQPVPAPVTQISYPSATASAALPDSPPSNAIDGNFETIWSAGSHPEQWIQIDLGQPKTISAIRLIISQYPAGETIHQIRVGSDANKLTLIHEFKGFTVDPNILEFKPSSPFKDIRYIKIVTTKSPSWVAWREIEIITPPNR